MNVSDYAAILGHNPLFSELSKAQLEQILSISEEISLNPGEYLVNEGQLAREFFLILEGKVDVIKIDKKNRPCVLAELAQGDTIGELALLDSGARSASARAASFVKVLKIPFVKLQMLIENDSHLNKIIVQIAKKISTRLRTTNEVTVAALEKQLDEYKLRVAIGIFMVNIIIGLCLFTFALSNMAYFTRVVSSTTFITIPITVTFLILFLCMMKFSGLPLNAFGLTTKNWQQSLKESIVFTSVIILLLAVTKAILIHYLPAFHGRTVFEFYRYIKVSPDSSFTKEQVWLISLVCYWLIVSPLQEVIGRGGLQGPLELFLPGKYSALKAILISNLMFSTVHLFLSLEIAFIVFFAGLYFGWLYYRHNTLVGVVFAHALLGTGGFWILGLA